MPILIIRRSNKENIALNRYRIYYRNTIDELKLIVISYLKDFDYNSLSAFLYVNSMKEKLYMQFYSKVEKSDFYFNIEKDDSNYIEFRNYLIFPENSVEIDDKKFISLKSCTSQDFS